MRKTLVLAGLAGRSAPREVHCVHLSRGGVVAGISYLCFAELRRESGALTFQAQGLALVELALETVDG